MSADPPTSLGRWDAIGLGLRSWALEHPHDFALIYGSPVPDYTAPTERTTPAGTAVLAVLLTLLDDVDRAGRRAPAPGLGHDRDDAEAALAEMLADDFFTGTTIDVTALSQGLAAWTLLLGAVTSEAFGQLGPLPDAEALFRYLLVSARGLFLATGLNPAVPARGKPSTFVHRLFHTCVHSVTPRDRRLRPADAVDPPPVDNSCGGLVSLSTDSGCHCRLWACVVDLSTQT